MKKHLTLKDRYTIEELLNEGNSFKKIGKEVRKDCTTIAKEVQKNFTIVKPSGFNNSGNLCKDKRDCSYINLCSKHCNTPCKLCSKCNSICSNFNPDICKNLFSPPYVCNGCNERKYCRKEKHIYKGKEAHEAYKELLTSARVGINMTREELEKIRKTVVPAIKKGHSPAIIVMNNPDLGRSESSIYRDITNKVYSEINDADLPNKVKMKKRRSSIEDDEEPRTTKNREERTYDDMLVYKTNHPNAKIFQFDTVEGQKGGKCILTIFFPSISLMLGFLADAQKSKIIVSKFQLIKKAWKERFVIDFEIGLTDNGKEFQLPDEIEYYDEQHKIHIFYCDPGKSYQKAEIENNHKFIRRILPKGTSFDNLTQEDIELIMNHINSTPREELNGHTPYELACITIGEDIINHFCKPIPRNEVVLKPELLKRKKEK